MTGSCLRHFILDLLLLPLKCVQVQIKHIVEPIYTVVAAMSVHQITDEGCCVVVTFVGLLASAFNLFPGVGVDVIGDDIVKGVKTIPAAKNVHDSLVKDCGVGSTAVWSVVGTDYSP